MKEEVWASRPGGAPSWPKELGVLGLLLLFALMLRLPFFFPAVVSWDESTYVLMGQSILDGHLPYLQQWENQPPLAFVFYAGVIAVFGKDLVGVRLAGTLCVAAAAFLVYLTAARLWNRRAGMLAAALCVAAVSLLRGGQATMTEHAALPALVGALCLLVHREPSAGTLFAAGALMAAAALVRLDLAYVVVLLGLYLLAPSAAGSPIKAVERAAAYAAGGILVAGILWLPYMLAGEREIWWRSVITANLSYAGSQHSALRNLIAQTRHASGVWLNALLWLGALGGAVVTWRRWKSLGAAERRGLSLLILFAAGTGLAIIKSGPGYEHYLIQLAPFAALLAASLVRQLPPYPRRSALLLAGLLAVVSMRPILAEYRTMAARVRARQPLRHGAAYEIAAYLRRENTAGRPVFLLSDHIAYWFLGTYPPTRFVHPSNLAKEYLLRAVIGEDDSTEQELRKVLGKSPEFVVTDQHIWYLRGRARTLLQGILAEEYVPAAEIEGRKIYRKKAAGPIAYLAPAGFAKSAASPSMKPASSSPRTQWRSQTESGFKSRAPG